MLHRWTLRISFPVSRSSRSPAYIRPNSTWDSRQMFRVFWPHALALPSPTAIVPISWCPQSSQTWKLLAAFCSSSLMRSDYKVVAKCMSSPQTLDFTCLQFFSSQPTFWLHLHAAPLFTADILTSLACSSSLYSRHSWTSLHRTQYWLELPVI
jgi:hypothetical protein